MIGDLGMEILVPCLDKLNDLLYLDVSNNRLQDRGLLAIAMVIEQSSEL